MKKCFLIIILLVSIGFLGNTPSEGPSNSVTITLQNAEPGAPVKFGIPFPKGELMSPDHVRVLNKDGVEILSQTTKVNTWEPADNSIKWLWVFFFADDSDEYQVQYGPDVRKTIKPEYAIVFKNNQRENGFVEINTGPLRLRIDKSGSGFIDKIMYNPEADGFGEDHVIATGIKSRGSFLDLLDDAGIDTSKAVVHQHFIEKGSGPLHAIVRVEGEYQYNREDHENSPFVTYLHAYAGKSYVKVLHTITYTGIPDKSEPLNGRQHPDIATQTELILSEEERAQDDGLTQPKDRIASAGFGLHYHIDGEKRFRTALRDGEWFVDGSTDLIDHAVNGESLLSVFQTGPDPTRIPPVAESTKDERIGGFIARVQGNETLKEAEKAEGWIDLSDEKWGVSLGIRNMMEEYPNELVIDLDQNAMYAYTWSPNEVPMSFERSSTTPDAGMVGNFARGIAKTSEMVLNFHQGDDTDAVHRSVNYILNPPVAHAGANWYSNSGVFGSFAGTENNVPGLERSMQYKFKWMLFNQNWEPWYGMFDYGDVKNYYFNNQWFQWANNEPAQDFNWWIHFMRGGDPAIYKMAQAASRHTMDVDNTHWPKPKVYRGDTNRSLDWFHSEQQPESSVYTGIGRRHAGQQWTSKLSAHVWIQGWLASYHLDGYHRGLDIARMTGDYYVRRIFGDHGLTGRRLYLSVWSLSELYDATKDQVYLDELNDRVDRMLALQRKQGGRIVIDRYGYSQNYVSHGLSKYLQMFHRPDIEQALVDHGRSLYNVAPLDHDFESFLASIHPLITGYDLTGEEEFLIEACARASHLVTAEMNGSFESFATQGDLAEEIERVSNLPSSGEGPSFWGRRPIWSFSGGLRIFGWTHSMSVPWLIDRLEQRTDLAGLQCAEQN